MKVYLAGFAWSVPGNVSSADFCWFLKRLNKERFKFHGHDRYVIVSELDGYVVGAILTTRTNKKYTTLSLKDIKLHVHRHKDDEPGADFNLFVLNPTEADEKLHGLYMHYHHTMKTRSFNAFIRRRFVNFQKGQRKKLAKGKTLTESEKKDLRRKYPVSMGVAEKIRAGTRDAWLDGLARLASVEYYVTTAMPGGGIFNDLGDAVLHRKTKVTFRAKARAQDVKTGVRDFLRRHNPRKGSLVGTDAKDRKLSIPLEKPPQVFEILEYDDVVKDGFLNAEEIAATELLAMMVELAKGNPSEFGPKPPLPKKEKP